MDIASGQQSSLCYSKQFRRSADRCKERLHQQLYKATAFRALSFYLLVERFLQKLYTLLLGLNELLKARPFGFVIEKIEKIPDGRMSIKQLYLKFM